MSRSNLVLERENARLRAENERLLLENAKAHYTLKVIRPGFIGRWLLRREVKRLAAEAARRQAVVP